MAEGTEYEHHDDIGFPRQARTLAPRGIHAPKRAEALSHDEWDALGRLWAEVARFPLGQAEEATRYALVRLAMLLGGSIAGVTLISRRPGPVDRRLAVFRGWRPVDIMAMGVDGKTLDAAVELFLKPSAYAKAPAAWRTVAEPGRRRAYLIREIVADDESFESSTLAESLELFGSSDRLLAIQPLRSTLEAVVSLDRPKGAAPFTPRERRLLLEALRGLESTFIALGRSGGFIDAHEPLTPRERVVLNYLLTGLREADIAAELGMGRRSVHQRITDVYRKFGVTSRPQLMALWISPPS